MTEAEKQLRRTLAASCGTCCILTSTQSKRLRLMLDRGEIDEAMIDRVGWRGLARQILDTAPGSR